MTDWTALNRRNWNERAVAHAASPDYEMHRFLAEPEFLTGVVRFDRALLGDVTGADGVHLQCHIGTDTISLARLGARMTGLDFSDAAVTQARDLADRTGTPTTFVAADVYDAVSVLDAGPFDLVYVSMGSLCWLPDVRRWAQIVAALLRPGGRLFVRDVHPVLLALGDPRPDGLLTLEYPYFERPEPTAFDQPYTYVATDHEFVNTRSATWSHGLGEIVGAVLAAGLEVTGLVEHHTIPWNAFQGRTDPVGNGEFALRDRPERLPGSFTLQARRDQPSTGRSSGV